MLNAYSQEWMRQVADVLRGHPDVPGYTYPSDQNKFIPIPRDTRVSPEYNLTFNYILGVPG